MSHDSKTEPAVEAGRDTSQEISIRRLVEADEEAVLRLLQESFARWPRVDVSAEPIEHLRWKLCPDMEKPHKALSRVAEADGRIVGTGIHFDQRAKLGDRVVVCREVVDICVHPGYQAQGIYNKMRDFLQDESLERYALALSGGSAHPAMLRARSTSPQPQEFVGNRFQRFVRPLTWRELLPAMRLRLDRSPGRLPQSAWQAVRWVAGRLRERTRYEAPPCSINTVETFDGRMDAFWQEASRPFAFITVRDRQYLEWRYGDRRAGNFTIKLAELNGALLGYTVLSVDPGGDKGYIADLLTLPGRQDIARSLFLEALDHFRRAGQVRVECWLPDHHPYRPTLDELGFLPRPQRRYGGTWQRLGASEDELGFLRDPEAPIHRTLGDTDMV